MPYWFKSFIFFVLTASFFSCQSNAPVALFENVAGKKSGIDFQNQLDYNEKLNAYTYRNFYNGAGVAIGDINNDGLSDIYFSGNLVDNKLFLNKGNFQFEDITQQAGVACQNVWSSGVAMADVNGDGLLDIFVCKSGPLEGDARYNQLFINNGDLTFTDKAEAYGIADVGLSIHAAFFDYDRDGDLDFYLLNNSTRSVGVFDLIPDQREIPDPNGGNKLYRNDGERFTEVTQEAGIYNSAIGFGLGVTVADVNQDNWPDIFVSNDFFERDYLYLNNQDGTFSEALEKMVPETSMGSMGADIADLNDDGFPEIYVTEMLPETQDRVKTKTVFESWDKYRANVENGYHHQFTRNTLQLNLGPNPQDSSQVLFSEVSRLNKVHATDWSWGALIFDFDNDSKSDIFVANGVYKDLTDQDYVNFYANNTLVYEKYRDDSVVITKMIDAIPSVPLENHLYHNQGDLQFVSVASAMGLGEKVFSNGSAYGDLDNDGDLDLVVSNINSQALVYKNLSTERHNNNYLKVAFEPQEAHELFGTKVIVTSNGVSQHKEYHPVKGYMSSMDHVMHFGLGKNTVVEQMEILWPDDTRTILKNPGLNQLLTLSKKQLETQAYEKESDMTQLFSEIKVIGVAEHKENPFSDFDRDRLLFQMSSNEGPAMAVADVNQDGLEDFYLGGAKGYSGQLHLQQSDQSFKVHSGSFESDKLSEDIDADFADIDNDGDLDLVVASGGYEYGAGDPNLQDRIYFNDGKGNFSRIEWKAFQAVNESSGFIELLDYDGDGDLDVVSGTRSIPFAYGLPGSIHLYENSNGSFLPIRNRYDDFEDVGMMTAGIATDIDADGLTDLVVSGEWMPITIFKNTPNGFKATQLTNSSGLWHSMRVTDLNGDGLPDIIAGNHGTNSRLTASNDQPLAMYVNDFDQNGSIEQIVTQYEKGKSFPIVLLPDLVKQLPNLRKKYVKHESYKDQSIQDIFEAETLSRTVKLEVQTLESKVFYGQSDGTYQSSPLPSEAQFSQVFSILAGDIDDDGLQDLIIGGNQTRMKPELGINNASYGLTLLNSKDGKLRPLRPSESGIYVKNDTRQIKKLRLGQNDVLMFIRSNERSVVFKKNRP